ncbi:MAG: hypothetical protein K8S97_01470 [Anaerolineae bacterium]|nr:hypothetical protein [Anaerolineae bacterium]
MISARAFSRYLVFIVLAVALLTTGYPIGAQDGDGPERTGLRPDAPPYGVRGPHAVGVMKLDSGTGDYMANVLVWYPTTDAEADYTYEIRYEAVPLPIDVYGHAALDGAPDAGPFPLIVYSPAASSPPELWVYYVEHLASYGFVVISADTEDNFANTPPGDYDTNSHRYFISRPQDASRLLDFAETLTADGGSLAGVIDMERVGISGMSRGGTTSLMITGAQLDLNHWATLCEATPDAPRCADILGNIDVMVDLAGLDAVPEGLWPSQADPRVDVAVAVVPATNIFGPEGEAQMDKPVLVIAAGLDAYWSYADLGSAQKTEVVLLNAGHVVHITACEDVPAVLAFGYNVCADMVWDQNRAHDLMDHFAAAFFLAHLYDDADAAAALAPDAVQFPGITYETTEF